jgi:hypothetical protein
MPDVDTVQVNQLLQAIATLEAQQRELGLDHSPQIAQLRQRLGEISGLSQSGSGAIATTGGVAAGEGGVAVRGDVHGNICLGPPARDPAEALKIYRRVLVEGCRYMSLRGLDIGASDPTTAQQGLELAQVYVNLLTTTQAPPAGEEPQIGERERRHLSVLEALAGHRHVVLLGDPGSGKSTFSATWPSAWLYKVWNPSEIGWNVCLAGRRGMQTWCPYWSRYGILPDGCRTHRRVMLNPDICGTS